MSRPVFVDTSALLALLVVNDVSHDAARAAFEEVFAFDGHFDVDGLSPV